MGDDDAAANVRVQSVAGWVRQDADQRLDEGLLERVADLAGSLVVDDHHQRYSGRSTAATNSSGTDRAGSTSCLREW